MTSITYAITGQPYTDYDTVYANNKPVSATYSDGETAAWTYNSAGTLQELDLRRRCRQMVYVKRHALWRQRQSDERSLDRWVYHNPDRDLEQRRHDR